MADNSKLNPRRATGAAGRAKPPWHGFASLSDLAKKKVFDRYKSKLDKVKNPQAKPRYGYRGRENPWPPEGYKTPTKKEYEASPKPRYGYRGRENPESIERGRDDYSAMVNRKKKWPPEGYRTPTKKEYGAGSKPRPSPPRDVRPRHYPAPVDPPIPAPRSGLKKQWNWPTEDY